MTHAGYPGIQISHIPYFLNSKPPAAPVLFKVERKPYNGKFDYKWQIGNVSRQIKEFDPFIPLHHGITQSGFPRTCHTYHFNYMRVIAHEYVRRFQDRIFLERTGRLEFRAGSILSRREFGQSHFSKLHCFDK